MYKIKVKTLTLTFCLVFVSHISLWAQNTEEVCEKITRILQVIEEIHYEPTEINDDYSEKLFSIFIKRLDREGLFFTNEGLEKLYKHQNQLDDYIKSGECTFLSDFFVYYQGSLKNVEGIINKLENQTLDFTQNDSIKLGNRSLKEKFALDEVELIKKWQKHLKYQVLNQLYQEESPDEVWSLELIKAKEENTRKKVIEKLKCNIQKNLNRPYGLEHYISSVFINSLLALFDPHTNYFSQEDLNAFVGSLSKENKGLGITLSMNDNDEIEVEQLLPGGAAWKSNNLHKKDVILKAQIADKSFEVACAEPEDLENFIQSSNDVKVELRIRKSNGEIKDIILYKETIENEENIVQGFLSIVR